MLRDYDGYEKQDGDEGHEQRSAPGCGATLLKAAVVIHFTSPRAAS